MRVTCQNISEFLECLSSESSIFQNTIRLNITKEPMSGKNRLNATSFEVILQASVVIQAENGNEYLLDMGYWCGIDRTEEGDQKEGTEIANVIKSKLEIYAEERKFKILPGVLDY